MKDPRESSLSFKNIFKRETKLAAYIIACMTVVVMSISYALFFQINSNTENQVVEAGNLAFTYENGNNAINSNDNTKKICFQPMSEEEANLYWDVCSYHFSVKNTGSLIGSYSIKLSPMDENTVDSSKLVVILRKKPIEGNAPLEPEKGFPKSLAPKTELTGEETDGVEVQDDGSLVLLKDQRINKNETIEYYIQIYFDETKYSDEEGNKDEGKVLKYQITGTGLVHDEQPSSENPVETLPLEEVFPNVDIDTMDENGNGLMTQHHEESDVGEEVLAEGFKNGELRYVGKSPNNYVWFNCDEGQTSGDSCELWRIIGLVNVKTTSGITQRLKIIKDESIGTFTWDLSEEDINNGLGVNEWSQANIMKVLNPGYEDNIDYTCTFLDYSDYPESCDDREHRVAAYNSLYWDGKSGMCSYDAKCDFTDKGLKRSAAYIADDIIWNTGSTRDDDFWTSENSLPHHFYEFERGNAFGNICNPELGYEGCNNDTVSRKYEWKTEGNKQALVGLMYPSDYIYSFGGTNRDICLNTSLMDWMNLDECSNFGDSWMLNEDNYNEWWTMSPIAITQYNNLVFIVDFQQYPHGKNTNESADVHPVVYLKGNVKMADNDADGSMESPYSLEIVQ